MTKNSKLRAVVRHEFLSIVKQPSFWISLFIIPLIAGIVILIGALTSTDDKDIDPAKNKLNVAVIDKSGLIASDTIKSFDLKQEQPAKQAELEKSVQSGKLDGLIVYPANLVKTGSYQLYADTTEKDTADGIVTELGRIVLQQSLLSPLASPDVAALALSGGEGTMQSYTDGKPTRGFSEYIVPGAFLIVFYIVLIFSVGYALSSVSEEKENRSIEMVLSYVKPQTLILGKLLSIILVTLTQILTFAVTGLVAYIIFRSLGNDVSLPFTASELTFIPSEVLIGIGFLLFGFVFYVALMAMMGAIFPSAKEANSFSTVFFILPAVPFWGIDAITAQEPSLFTHILTYFPLTSPTTTLLRNAVGNLSIMEGLISLAILIATTIAAILLAAKAFRLGTLEYKDRVKFSTLFSK
ncbi:MAG TPA: ABC transporter permease [Candidatus Saccharimonadales bacterium]|nr:ABC transporter permease [Candidatus Saccharimonadales bacterium]